ncbi:MAG: hypothetical protein H6807_14595 [Planctomycetes bacterium]|nr:hypothetical protein [Planctomycetota bacterium]
MATTRPSRRRGQDQDEGRRRGREKVDPRQAKNSADNKLALQATIACVVLLGIVFTLVVLGKGDPTPGPAKPEAREDPIQLEGPNRIRKPEEQSKIPIKLANQFLIGLGSDDQERIGKLIWWDRLFAQKEMESKRAEKDRYANLDDDAKAAMRDRFLLMVMDPDYEKIVSEYALKKLTAGTFTWDIADIGADYGNVRMRIEDNDEKTLLVFDIRTEIKPGFDTVRDAQNDAAWAIVGIEHEVHNRVNALGQRVRPAKKDYVEELYAADRREDRKKRRRASAGPPEADPVLVDWLEGTSDSTKTDIERLCAQTIQEDDLRAAMNARDDLINRGKIAIPGILRAMSQLDYEEDSGEIKQTFFLIQVLREMTGKQFNFRPDTTTMAFGQGGMTRSTPEERRKAVRRWFGWWETNKATWTKRVDEPEPESWEELTGEEEEDGKKDK